MKTSNAQTTLLHSAESLGVGAGMTVLTALYQYFILHGFNVQGLVGVGCISFIGAFSMVYKSLTANPNLAPAISDTVAELKDTIESHTHAISALQGAMQAAQASNAAPAAPQVSLQSAATSATQVPQLAFSTAIPYQPSSTFPMPSVQASQVSQ